MFLNFSVIVIERTSLFVALLEIYFWSNGSDRQSTFILGYNAHWNGTTSMFG